MGLIKTIISIYGNVSAVINNEAEQNKKVEHPGLALYTPFTVQNALNLCLLMPD